MKTKKIVKMSKVKWQMESAMTIIPPLNRKFTLEEWKNHNMHRFKCSEAQQELAEHLVSESQQVCESTTEKVKMNKEETDYRLKEKLEDIKFLKQELLRIRKDVVLEIDALLTFKERIIHALNAVKKNAFDICGKCLQARNLRLGIDLVVDEVQKELEKEREVIKGVENLLVRVLEQNQEQIRRLKSTLYFMDRDLKDKDENFKIDESNFQLKETSLNLSIYYGTSSLNASTISLNEWEMQTKKNIVTAAKEVNTARPLRCYIDKILKQIADDLINQKNTTDEALRQRIEETRLAKIKLEKEHSEVMRQANEMTRTITNIEKAIAEKEGFMALAHTRLGKRCGRPGLEFTSDRVENSLTTEVVELREIAKELQRKLYEAQACLRYLLKIQIQLEEDINIKTNTLKIDEVDCLTMRQSLDFHAY